MRKRNLKLKEHGISCKRYNELMWYCRQYPDWVSELNNMAVIKSQNVTGMPNGSGKTSNQTEELAIKRQELFNKCELIEQTAIEADGDLYQYIIKNVCYDKPVDYLITHGMPCSAPSFYDKRRYFFYLLDKNKKY